MPLSGLHLALLCTWLVAHAASVQWVYRGLLGDDGRVHLVVAVLLVLWGVREAREHGLQGVSAAPSAPWTAWAMVAVPPLLAAPFGLSSLTAAAGCLSLYGLLGVFVGEARWRRYRPLLLLGLAILPVSAHVDVLVGVPLRTWTAGLVADVLGVPARSTVLEVEGGLAAVDLPCSGVEGLWSSTVILAGVALVRERTLGVRWLLGWAATLAALVLTNLARVLVLVVLVHLLELPLLAEVLHTPIGLVAFAGGLLPGLSVPADGPAAGSRSFRMAVPAMVVLLLSLAVPVTEGDARPSPVPVLPQGWTLLTPTETERTFIGGRGGVLRKGGFEEGALRGSAALVVSRSWVTQHGPELCHEAAGWSMTGEHPARIADTPVRRASLQRGRELGTALWWFESPEHVTADQAERIARGLVDDAPWVLVSVFVEGRPDAADPDLEAVVRALRHADRNLFASQEG